MNRSLAAMVAVAVLAAGTAGCDSPQATPTAKDAGTDCGLSAWAKAGFSGAIAISTGTTFDCVGGFGSADRATGTPNTPDTVFSIGSVSKAFTAAAVLHLVDDGKLSLGDRAGDLIPGLGGPVASATVHQLLLHTSGLTGSHGADHRPLERDAAVAAIGGLAQDFAPGSKFLYSNAGYTLLALIVEQRSGMSYREYLASKILRLPDGRVAGGFWDGDPSAPGPRAVGYLEDGPTKVMGDFPGPHWALAGNGDLAMTMRDLATWTRALFSGQVVSPESVKVIRGPGFDRGNGSAEVPGWGSVDKTRYGEPFFTTAGGGGDIGHNAVVVWLPERQRAIVIASNTPDVTAEQLLTAVGPALAAGQPVPAPDAPVDVDPAELAAFAGKYKLDTGGSFDATARDNRLAISASGTDAVAALFPLPEGVTAGGVSTHEKQVMALLAGETPEGREERAAIESRAGPISDVKLAGTIVHHGELRTYAALTSGTKAITAWYSLNDEGGIAAAEIVPAPPTRLFVPSAGGGYRPDDPTGADPKLTVVFEDGRLTVTGPAGSTGAARVVG